jgi:ankyrin repeat protein
MDEFFTAIEAGSVAAVRTLLERDSSLANAATVVTRRATPDQEEEDVLCGSGLPREPQPPGKPRPPFTRTALAAAVKHKRPDIARLLLEFGAAVNATTERQPAVLLYAVQFYESNLELVRLLVEAGADVNARSKGNNTPLNAAFRWHQDAWPVVKLLLDHGADVNARADQGRTPLRTAVQYLASPAIDHVRMIETLLQFGANPNPPRLDEKDPGPPLCDVVRSGNVQIVRMLVEAGADVNAPDRWGAPLHFAAEKGLDQIVELLLNAGADPSVRDPKGRVPIDLVEPMEEMTNHFEQLLEQR